MFLVLAHTGPDIFQVSKNPVLSCCLEAKAFRSEEKFGIIQQVRRALLSVHLNIAQGSSRKSMAERNKLYEIARSSLIEIDSALDDAVELGYTSTEKLGKPGELMVRSFLIISKKISK